MSQTPRTGLQATLVVALLAGVALIAVGPARAASSASSASSEGSSASVGSLSTSVEGSSRSSTGGNRFVEGAYRIVEIAAAPERPGMVRLRLQPVADAASAAALALVLPEQALQAAALGTGALVELRDRAWGLEFSHGQPQRPFFLALRDDGLRELRTRPLAPTL
ncbi:MAG: hypothetical protein ACOYLV_15225 [Rubrivivax sp.]|jgi:hypothetical protein